MTGAGFCHVRFPLGDVYTFGDVVNMLSELVNDLSDVDKLL